MEPGQSPERTVRLKNNLLSSRYELCIERMKFFTEAYRQNPDLPPLLKRARAVAHTLRNMTIFIREDELLVGNETSKNLGDKFNFDLHRFNLDLDRSRFEGLSRRNPQPFFIEEKDIDPLLEMIPFWKGMSLAGDIIPAALFREGLIPSPHGIAALVPNIAVQIGTTEGHLSAGYGKLLRLGYPGIVAEAKARRDRLNQDDPESVEKRDFYEAVEILYGAAMDFSRRYSELAAEIEAKESRPDRRRELSVLAEMMTKLRSDPPETFYEAVQLIWFSQNIANIIYQRSVLAPGRLDQILWPYYDSDLKAGRITRESALELIEELNLKLTWNAVLLPDEMTTVANALGQNTQAVTISGTGPDGTDATNELSWLFLEAYRNLKAFTSDLSVRIHRNTPSDFFREAVSVFRSTTGLAFYNDEVIIPALRKAGYTESDARDYVIVGCVEPTGQGNSFAATGRMFMNLPGVLELTLYNGFSQATGGVGGLETGDPAGFRLFDDLYEAFARQLRHNIGLSVRIAAVSDRETMAHFQHPFVSAMLDGCLETGRDYVCGGAKYNLSSITAYGFATLVNSLHNIKKVVFEEKRMSLPDLISILSTDFEGQEPVRQMLINKYEKWGNDQPEIDELACRVWDLFTREVAAHPPLRGGRYSAGAYSMGIHVMQGFMTRPSADGRKAFEPISNSLSPVNGSERNGLTAVLNSIARLDYGYAANGVAVNIRVHPQNIEKEENLNKFCHLLKTYFHCGGMQVQPTVVSTETLRDAQAHPEKYRDLIVKVGGYNATYIDLGVPIQNEIISRMEHALR